jgi:hypothetical protein
MPKFLTLVYTIHDEEAFRKEKDSINEKFKSSKGEPWAITAMSADHEIQRVHWIEEALNSDDIHAANEAIGRVNIGDVNSLDEL